MSLLSKKSLLLLTSSSLLSGCFDRVEYLDQGWNDENQYRNLSYQTSQGSQLIPYTWFLNLTEAGSNKLIKSDEVIEKLRYLPDYFYDPAANPDKLPVGFVKDSDPQTGDWIGINCSGCHTAQINVDNVALRIDGAPSMGDYAGLLITVRDGLTDTVNNRAKMRRFAKAILGNLNRQAVDELKQQMLASRDEISDIISRNYSADHVPGYGRIDAFSSIRNEIFVHDLGIADNMITPNAPVSFPFLWDTPKLDKVQWAGNVENPYARNTGQVFGVLGRLDLQNPDTLFATSVRRDNLFNLENWLAQLESPKWPEAYFGELDQDAVERGKQVYLTEKTSGYACVDCHSIKDENGQYPLTPASQNLFGKQFIKTVNTPIAEIGTDPSTIQVIYNPEPVQTGLLASILGQTEMFGAELLSTITALSLKHLFESEPALSDAEKALYSDFRFYAPGYTPPPPVIGYKARPLAGIWATSPYLHNGSVPNLYQLLLPVEQRVEGFYMGSQTFDSELVGYENIEEDNTFWFDTNIAGNLNTGHEYGTDLTHQQKMDLIEYMKSL